MKVWAIALAALAAGGVAWAEATRNEKFGVEIAFPEKWLVGSGEEPLLMMSRSSDPVSLANCVATGEQVPDTRPLTQAQLNEGLSAPFGEEFWRRIYASAGLKAEVKSQSARLHKSGVTIQEAYFDLSKEGAAPASKMSVQQAIFVRPGYTVTLACSARAGVYALHKKALSDVIDSVRFFAPSPPVASGDAVAVPVASAKFTAEGAAKASLSAVRAGQALIDLDK